MWPFVSGLFQHRVHLCCSMNQYFTPLMYELFNSWVYHILFIYSSVHRHLSKFLSFGSHERWMILWTNWTFMYKILFECLLLVLLSLIPTGGITWSCGNSMISLLGIHQTIFYSGCTILCSQQQCMRVLFVFHSLANIC